MEKCKIKNKSLLERKNIEESTSLKKVSAVIFSSRLDIGPDFCCAERFLSTSIGH